MSCVLLMLCFIPREAIKRGDILFVGSSGNNGSTPTLKDGKLTSALNPGNFPGKCNLAAELAEQGLLVNMHYCRGVLRLGYGCTCSAERAAPSWPFE